MSTSMVELELEHEHEHDHGCRFIGGIIRCRKIRKPYVPSLPSSTHNKNLVTKVSKEEQGNSEKLTIQKNSKMVSSPRVSVTESQGKSQSQRVSYAARNCNAARISNGTTTARISSSSSGSSTNLALVKVHKSDQNDQLGSDPNNKITKTNQNYPQNTAIPRVSSGNILKLAQTNGLYIQGNENSPRKSLSNNMSNKTLDCKGTMGNILRGNSEDIRVQGYMSKIEPGELKFMGNEKYQQGKYEEALELYNQAIALDANMAVYRSNKGTVLTALGRVLEAVVECKEAVRIDPSYSRAHHRLAVLYFRLGFPEEAIKHFKHSGSTANFIDNNQAKALGTCISKCTDAQSRKDWTALTRQSQNALALGADSALQVYAFQAQALLNLHSHDEAYDVFRQKPSFDMDSYTRLFGQERSIFVYSIETQVYTATGRFEEATKAAQNALELDPNDKDLRTMLIKTQSISISRSKGNKLFKEQNFLEACNAYNEGLEYSPYNSILLSNRAACRSKLGQFEKALEDSTLALNLQPTYSKARLRRAHCNSQLGRWEAAIQDYEILIREKPGSEDVGRALFEAKIQFKKQCGEDVVDVKFGTDVISVSSIECFRHLITSPGMSVVLFCNKSNQEKALPMLQQVCLRFPSINFLKVEVEDHPYLVKSEEVNYIPAFKIYKNGSRVRDIPGNNFQLLESSVKLYSS